HLASPAGSGSAQLSPKLLHLLRQVIDGGSVLRRGLGSGTDVNPLAGLPNQQALRPQLRYRSSDHCGGDPVTSGQFCSGRDGRANRELPFGDPPPEFVGDLLVRRAPNDISHLVAFLDLVRLDAWNGTPTLAESRSPTNYTYNDEHSVLACCG